MPSNCGHRIQLKLKWKYYKEFKTNSSESLLLGTSPMTLYIVISTCHTLEIKRLGQRYADRMVERPNVLATNLMKEEETTRRLKIKNKIISRLVYLIVL